MTVSVERDERRIAGGRRGGTDAGKRLDLRPPDSATNTPARCIRAHDLDHRERHDAQRSVKSRRCRASCATVNGTPIADVPITWTTSPTTVATIASTSASAGLLTAKGVGTATIYAKADTVVRSITVTVIDSAGTTTPAPSVPAGASGGSYGSATAAELPAGRVNTAYPAAARQIRVPAGANLQAAIDAAQPGDELLLAPGATYIGNFMLRNKGELNGMDHHPHRCLRRQSSARRARA